MLSLRALSNHEHFRETPSRFRVEAQLVQPDLSVHEFFVRLLRQIRLCSLCWGWPPFFEAILPGSDAIMIHARRPLPLSSVDLVWREGELSANSPLRSRYTAYPDFVNQHQRWTPSRQRDLLGRARTVQETTGCQAAAGLVPVSGRGWSSLIPAISA